MNYAEIKHFDIANGEGVRTTLFVSGCRRGCKNCFNEVAWNFAAGKPFTREVEDEIIDSLRPDYVDGLTLLGGEPMEPENQAGLVEFVERVRAEFPRGRGKTIWCFTGDTWDVELVAGMSMIRWLDDPRKRNVMSCRLWTNGPSTRTSRHPRSLSVHSV